MMVDTLSVEDKRRLVAVLLEKRRRAVGSRPDLLGWTIINRRMLAPNVPFRLENHLYLRGIYECGAQRMVIMKAGQVGVSEYAVSRAFFTCDVLGGNVFYVMPTDDDVSDFSQMRFTTALEASAYLRGLVSEAGDDKKRQQIDRVSMKRVGDNFIVFRGGRVDKEGKARQLKAVPADLVIRDERDEMDKRVREISNKRLGHSLLKQELDISTPSWVGSGIDVDWQECDQREWFVACPHCGLRQELLIEGVVVEWDGLARPVAWHGMDKGRAFVACLKCGKELDRLGRGEWVARFPGREVAGFRPTKLFSAQTELIEVVNNLRTTDEGRRKEAWNQDLGRPYRMTGTSINAEVLDKCRREYAHGPAGETLVFMGVDVGAVFHVVIRGDANGERGERRQLWAGIVDSTAAVVNLARLYRVSRMVIDGLPETRESRKIQGALDRGIVWLAYYNLDSKYREDAQWNPAEGVVNADRTRSLDLTFSRFVEGMNTLPAGIRGVADYYDHLQAPGRQMVESGGRVVARYVEDGPDHFAHAENYCTLASLAPPAVTVAKARPRVVSRDDL